MADDIALKRPKGCDEPNCIRISTSNMDYDPEKPSSAWCFGVRTGPVKGKEQAVKNVPSDIFLNCTLIGSHSEYAGRHFYVENIADQYLQLYNWFRALEMAGLLQRTIRSFLVIGSNTAVDIIEDEIRRYRQEYESFRSGHIDAGSRFVEYICTCGEVLFREYNEDQGGVRGAGKRCYRPNRKDEALFWHHRRLGPSHKIMYRKCKMVKHSRKGDNPFWQEWGPYEYKFRRLTQDPFEHCMVQAVPAPAIPEKARPLPKPNIKPNGSYATPGLPKQGDPGHCDG